MEKKRCRRCSGSCSLLLLATRVRGRVVEGLGRRALERVLVQNAHVAARMGPGLSEADAGREAEELLSGQQLPNHPVDILEARIASLAPDGGGRTEVARLDVAGPVELHGHGP